MMRNLFLAICLIAAPGLAAAQSLEDRIAAALQAQGFSVVVMERTWLGRLRVVAQNDSHQRELVVDPATGEILQDYLATLAALAQRNAIIARDSDDRQVAQDWSAVVREPEAGVAVAIPDAASIAGD